MYAELANAFIDDNNDDDNNDDDDHDDGDDDVDVDVDDDDDDDGTTMMMRVGRCWGCSHDVVPHGARNRRSGPPWSHLTG